MTPAPKLYSTCMRRIASLLFLALAGLLAAAPLNRVLTAVGGEVRSAEAMEYMRRVYATDRWFTFPKFRETAEYLKRTLTAAGLTNVEIVEVPADGVTQYGYWTEPMAWDVTSARLELVDAGAPESMRVLADYAKTPASLGMWSGPTPAGGITADVVEYSDKADIRGKLVLTAQNPAGIKWLLAKKGALGAINTFTENPALEDGRQWINSWGDNGWAFTRNSTPLLCFSITPRQAAYLRKLLAAHRVVRVKATVDSRYYAGAYPYTTGIIRGETDEEVLTLGHTSEQGAQDNATGVAAQVESLAALHRLIAAGKLARPRRTIRILLMGEMYGSMPYVAANAARIRRTVAAMCVDTPAALYHLAGTEYTFYMNPHVAGSYTDAFVLRLAAEYFPTVKRPWHEKPFMTGTDTYLSEPMVGIPAVWPYSGSGVETHHNSEDTPARVDARSLRDLAVLNAAYLYYLAAAGEAEARWLAEVAQNRGYEQILRAAAPPLEPPTGQWLHETLEKIEYTAEREMESVRSVGRLLDSGQRPWMDALVAGLRRFGQEQAARWRASAGVEPIAPRPDPQAAAAAGIIVKRKRFGTIPLDEIAPDQREGYPSGAWAATPIIALYWCDGRRNLAEVMRLTRLELGPVKFDFVGYFRFLERRGYVEFR
jgi:peptidase M28-like protein